MSSKPCPNLSGKSGHSPPSPDPETLDGLTPEQSQAVEVLAQGKTTDQAAAAAGVASRTVRRWKKEPRFWSTLLELRREPFGQSIGLAQRFAPNALGALLRVMEDATVPAGVRVTASSTVLKYAWEGVEHDDLMQRVDAIEQLHGVPGTTTSRERPPLHIEGEGQGQPEDE